MKSNRLQLNSSKTEVMWCATSWRQHLLLAAGTVGWRRYGWPGDVSLWPWNLHRRRPEHENSRTANCVIVLCDTSSVATDSQTCIARHFPDTGGSSSSVATGLWQWRTGRPTSLPRVPTPVGTKCVSTNDLSDTSLRAHHRRVASLHWLRVPEVHLIQDCCADV